MPRVSIVMPIYNGVPFVGEAINSVLSQSLEDWELIVVDDGSTDTTQTILDNINDPRVLKLCQDNQGAAVARNTALNHATGEFIGFLDADDLYFPSALQDMVEFLDGFPTIDVVYSDGIICSADLKPIMRLTEIRPGIYTGRILDQVVLSSSVITVPACTLTRRAAITRNNTRFDSTLRPSEDWDFWIHLALDAQFAYLNRLACMYRIHDTNITKTVGEEQRRADLVRGRLKLMNSEWFSKLREETRKIFFHDLLIGLLDNNTDQQLAVIQGHSFQTLLSTSRSDLLRLVASNHIYNRRQFNFALWCIDQSLVLQPKNTKARFLAYLAHLSPRLATLGLWAWHILNQIRSCRRRGMHFPKPVPTSLLQSDN